MPGELTTAQKRAIPALLGARDVAEAAKVAGVGERTLRRWLKDDRAFLAELQAAEQDVVSASLRKLSDLAWEAASVLGTLMSDKDIAPGVRVRAADAVLARLLQLKGLMQLAERVAAIEAALRAKGEL